MTRGRDRSSTISCEGVSKFYGEVLGVNRVSVAFGAGITGLVGPNGSGKSTLLNLMTGLLRPTRGSVLVSGREPAASPELFRSLGYCAQFDSFPRGQTGFQFLSLFLQLHGYGEDEARRRAIRALERVNLIEAAQRKIAGYSKGMRQRVKLAQAMAHDPEILILDEPLNGLDPMARAEVIALFRELAEGGATLIISSHILHEVDMISDRVVLLNGGYVVAEGDIQSVRSEIPDRPIQVLVRCDRPGELASHLFRLDHVVEAKIQEDQKGLLIRTRNADHFYRHLNEAVLETELLVETVAPADEDVHSVYEYLIGDHGSSL